MRALSRVWVSAGLIFSIITIYLIYYGDVFTTASRFRYLRQPPTDLLKAQGSFWQRFRTDLEAHAPNVPALKHVEGINLAVGFNASEPRKRPDYLSMSIPQWEGLGKAHSAFVSTLHAMDYHLPWNYRTRGIVTTAGGPYLPVALVSIRMLRETGSVLPVEVFLSKWSEWDPVICDKLLPTLDAKCIVLQEIFDYDQKSREHELEKYQFKIMAMLFSSFEEILFLDSDAFAIHKPEDLFDAEPYKSTGLVLWPDFWCMSESPLFFEIAGIRAPPLHERPSTEAGQILYSKSKHALGLLLAAYYNYYGPDYYYPLQSQGAPGEGDKETFLWAANALDERFYTVKTSVRALGYKTKKGDWRGSAMAQFDPMQDFAPDESALRTMQLTNRTYPRPYFAHVNFPKLDPSQIFDPTSFGATGPTKDSDQKMRRIWFDDEATSVNFFGFDLERVIWSVVKDIACEYESMILSWKGKKDICKKATDYWKEIFET